MAACGALQQGQRRLRSVSRWLLPLLLVALALAPAADAQRNQSGSAAPAYASTLVLQYMDTAPLLTAAECPGAVAGECTGPCKLRVCGALQAFYRATNNASDPWDVERGWKEAEGVPCKTLLAAAPDEDGAPIYCHWYGVICCDAELLEAGTCRALHSVVALALPINNLNGSLQNPALFGAFSDLHACGLTSLNLESNNLIGGLTDEWGELHHLQILDIGCNWLNGSLPDRMHLRNLTFLHLGNNWLNGTLPLWLQQLPRLRVLSLGVQYGSNSDPAVQRPGLYGTIPPLLGKLRLLRDLSLDENALTGGLPEGLCGGSKGESALIKLNVRSNLLSGASAEVVELCTHLIQLDISHNEFTGSVPASRRWGQLASYSAGYNNFTGRFPARLAGARVLEHLDLSHLALTGLIPTAITLLSSLKELVLSDNRLAGTIEENIWYLPALTRLDLSNNLLVGTLPSAIGLSYSLRDLDLSNNEGLTGVLPPEMGLLPLRTVRATGTDLSCAGIIQPHNVTTNSSCSDPAECRTPRFFGTPSDTVPRCPNDQLLPCFLAFSDYYIPRDDDSNMRCRVILRQPLKAAREACAGDGPGKLGDRAQELPDSPTSRWLQRWTVDAEYYQYQSCQCLLGYDEVWDATGTVLTCVPERKERENRATIIACVLASTAVLFVGLLVLWQYLRTRPRWLRERVLQAKRSKGAPKASKLGERVRVSVVVTDVQNFTELTRRAPELTIKAMGGHNAILRKACHAHAGYVLEQEGDSWTVAFHDPEDAVAFSLQVTQALQQRVWNMRVAPSERGRKPQPSVVLSSKLSETGSAASSYDMLAGDGSLTARTSSGAGSISRQPGSYSTLGDDRSSAGGLRSRECSFSTGAGAPLGLLGPQGSTATPDYTPGVSRSAHRAQQRVTAAASCRGSTVTSLASSRTHLRGQTKPCTSRSSSQKAAGSRQAAACRWGGSSVVACGPAAAATARHSSAPPAGLGCCRPARCSCGGCRASAEAPPCQASCCR